MNVEQEVEFLKGLSEEIVSTLAVCCANRPKPVNIRLVEGREKIDPIHDPDPFSRHVSFLLEWEAKKPLVMNFPLLCRTNPKLMMDKVMAEVGALVWARRNTQLPVPAVRAYDPVGTQRWNATRRPFILQEHMRGKHITNDDWEQMTNDQKYKVVGAVAKVVAELAIHPFDKIGSLYPETVTVSQPNIIIGPLISYAVTRYSIIHHSNPNSSQLVQMFRASGSPYTSALDFMLQAANKHLMHRAMASPLPTDQYLELWIYRSLIPGLILDEYNHGPFVLLHGHLDRHACLFNEKYQLTGVIDWEFTHTVPLQIAAARPPFLLLLPIPRTDQFFQYLGWHYVSRLAY